MSKGINIFKHFTPKSDGHKDIGTDIKYPIVYCPKANDTVSANYTSAGMICSHCKKIY